MGTWKPDGAEGECGVRADYNINIVGGRVAKLGEFPYMALIGYTSPEGIIFWDQKFWALFLPPNLYASLFRKNLYLQCTVLKTVQLCTWGHFDRAKNIFEILSVPWTDIMLTRGSRSF